MRKLIVQASFFLLTPFIVIFALVLFLMAYRAQALDLPPTSTTIAYAALPTNQNSMTAEITEEDGRAEKVRQFLARYNSPLEPHAQDIIDAADEYELDYRLIPAIAMQESGLCKTIPYESYNCWGFGIYGSTVTRFKDYKEGIYTVTKALATRYRARGLVTPEQIMTMYTPSSNGSWAFSVNYFMNQLK